MNIYLIKRTSQIRYDETAGFVIVATNPRECRKIASNLHSDEGKDEWLNAKRSRVMKIGTTNRNRSAGMVLEDFNSGG